MILRLLQQYQDVNVEIIWQQKISNANLLTKPLKIAIAAEATNRTISAMSNGRR